MYATFDVFVVLSVVLLLWLRHILSHMWPGFYVDNNNRLVIWAVVLVVITCLSGNWVGSLDDMTFVDWELVNWMQAVSDRGWDGLLIPLE